ncbi:sensor histidine kinase [Neorhodopirellula lusitana]|uniref:sensor histidine kinase n=1 Tax=Neorhodopirellula lusitana TaxID=445327 RepID=UPI0038512C00
MQKGPDRRPITLRAPITLGVVLIVLVVILGAVWVTGTLIGALRGQASPELFWAMLFAGSVLLVAVLAGVIAYLTLSVKAFNLNRRQSNFIDAVTHELKSPIASLKLYLQTMTRHTVSQDQSEAFHRIMLEDVDRLDTLINHLLDAANVERGGMAEEARDVDLAAMIEQIGSATCVRYKLPSDTVIADCQDIILSAPPVQVEILLRNLIDNAVKYGGSPPRVRVIVEYRSASSSVIKGRRSKASKRAEKLAVKLGESSSTSQAADPVSDSATGEVTISVCDNGVGIPANLRRKVFGRFVRLGSELERSSPGTGLGLYLVRNVTHALGGRINIHDAEGVDFEKVAGAAEAESSIEMPASNDGIGSSASDVASGVLKGDGVTHDDAPPAPSVGTRFDITLPGARLASPDLAEVAQAE